MTAEPFDPKELQGSLAELRGLLEKMGSTPPSVTAATPEVPVRGTEDQTTPVGRKILSLSERFELRDALKSRSTSELTAMFNMQLADGGSKGVGIPYGVWAATGGGNVTDLMISNPEIKSALDTTGGAALIRQDLEPVLYEIFIRLFPAYDRFTKQPANGLVHTWQQATDFGDAKFLPELGTVTDDQQTYVRKTTNIGILATRRGVSLKEQFATLAGGAGFNPENLELQAGLRAMAHRMQVTIFQGNATVSSGTASDEEGEFDANAFTGLRQILNTANVVDLDPTAAPSGDDMRAALDAAVLPIINSGGSANIIYCRPEERQTFDLQQDANVRYINALANVTPGVTTNAVNTSLGPLPLSVVPGDSIGTYTRSGTDYADMYILDESSITLPYLGSAGPTVLDIPIGISGQLTHLYIIFLMSGLAVKATSFSNKVRVVQP